MGLFGKLIKTGFDIVTTPIDMARDIVEAALDPATGQPFERTKDKVAKLDSDAEEIRDALDEL